jgi:hypothetical protein
VTDTVSIPVTGRPAGQHGRLRFRASRAQAVLIAMPFALIAVAEAAERLIAPPQPAGRGSGWVYLAAAALFLVAMCAQAWFGTTLTADGVLVHSFRRQLIRWPDITCIRAEEFATNRVVAVYSFGSRRTRLRYPTSGALFGDPQFDAKLCVIQDWWADCSGRDRP